MKKNSLYLIVAFSAIFYSCEKNHAPDEKMNMSKATARVLAAGKKVYIPKVIWNIPTNNDYNNDASLYSNMRRAETDNFVAFWAKDFGGVFLFRGSARQIVEPINGTHQAFNPCQTIERKN